MQELKIVLIGYGKMGHVIEEIACARGHEIVLTIDRDEEHLFDDPRFAAADVAIEFTAPAWLMTIVAELSTAGYP